MSNWDFTASGLHFETAHKTSKHVSIGRCWGPDSGSMTSFESKSPWHVWGNTTVKIGGWGDWYRDCIVLNPIKKNCQIKLEICSQSLWCQLNRAPDSNTRFLSFLIFVFYLSYQIMIRADFRPASFHCEPQVALCLCEQSSGTTSLRSALVGTPWPWELIKKDKSINEL